jgi:folate-binding protein YgfZ
MPEQSPLHLFTQTAGATFTEHQGWLMPASFGSVDDEYRVLRSQVGMIDLSHRSKVTLRGKDRASFLHNFCTNEIVKAPIGSCCEAFLTTHQAKILAWMQINFGQEEITFHAEPGLSQKIITYLDRYLITEEVEFTDRTTQDGLLLISGPEAEAKLNVPQELLHRQHQTILIESSQSKFPEYLAKKAETLHLTLAQKAVADKVLSSLTHFDAEQLCRALEQDGIKVSRATAYRTLTKLVDAGVLRQTDLGSGAVYDLIGSSGGSVLKNVIEVRVERNDMFGQSGFFLSVSQEAVTTVWQALLDKGIRPVGLEAYELLRVEAGVPAYGQDIDETNLPQEVDRTDAAISFTKGCYIGQETVARIRAYGHVNRLLRKLVLPLLTDENLVSHKLFHNGQEVGQITSAIASPHLGTTLALGYVRRGHNEPGTIVEVETANRRIPATLHKAKES